jgi:hypothetical protein
MLPALLLLLLPPLLLPPPHCIRRFCRRNRRNRLIPLWH